MTICGLSALFLFAPSHGPSVSVTVVDIFYLRPLPLVFFLVAAGVAGLCLGPGSSTLPARAAFWRIALYALLVSCVVLVAAMVMVPVLAIGFPALFFASAMASLVVAAVGAVVAAGLGAVRLTTLGFAAVCWLLAGGVIAVWLLPLPMGSPGWYLALSAHAVSNQVAYATFLVVALFAPLELLGHLDQRRQQTRKLATATRRPRLLALACAVSGVVLLCLAAWRSDDRGSVVFWVVATLAAAVVVSLVAASAARPLPSEDMSVAVFIVAGTVAAKYLVISLQPWAPVPPETLFHVALQAGSWSWLALLAGTGVMFLRRRRVNTGVALLALTAIVALTRRLGTGVPLAAAAAMTLLLTGLVLALAWRPPTTVGATDGWGARRTAALSRAAVLAALAVGVMELAPKGYIERSLYSWGVVLGTTWLLLFNQPGRHLPIPQRGAAYLRACTPALLLVSAQGVLLAAPLGQAISVGVQNEAVNLLALPLLVVLASHHAPAESPRSTA